MFALSRVLAGSARIAVVGKPFVLAKAVDAAAFTSARALATAAASKKATTTTKKTAAGSKATATKKAPTKTAAKGKASATTAAKKKAPAKKTTAAAKKKAPAKKKAATTATKKVKSPEEKAADKMRDNVKELKEKALQPPKSRTNTSSWIAFCRQKFAENPKVKPFDLMKELSEQYRAMTPEQRKAIEAPESNKAALQDELAAWVAKHSANEIYHANLARAQLRKLRAMDPPPYGVKVESWRAIPDPRLPTGVRTAAVWYTMERFKSVPKEGQFSALGGIMKDWKDLPASEKKKYLDMQAKDQERYKHEMDTLGIVRASKSKKSEE